MANDVHQDNPLPPTGPYEKVNSLCASFSHDWQPDARPAFDLYLAQVADDAQPTLLRNLLHIEIDRRRACGEQPTAEEYLLKFPRLAVLIRQVFLESSAVLTTGQRDTADVRPVAGTPPASRLGDYQLLRELGRGGMGSVYEAVHLKHGNRVALKTLPQVDGARLYQFKREFRALADVNHPNLIGLHTLESDGCHWFFTMDLIDGVDFLSYVRPAGVLDLARLKQALAQLVTGVLALHGKHIIHRDLKPSNVMVTQEGRVIVLDFGLVLEEEQSWSTDKIAGTPRYMAPEQAAGGKITAACDWYAVGVMLYEALTGNAPFVGGKLQVLQAKQTQNAPELPADASVPADLASLTRRLLHREPGQRPDAREIVKVIAFQADAPGPVRLQVGSALVGREQQLVALGDAHRWLRKQQQPLSVFIRGRSGEGKTSLAEHFLAPLRSRVTEVAVMSGRCYDRESVPFKALDSLIDALCVHLRSLPETDAALLIPDDMDMLVRVFPVLQRVHVVARAVGKALVRLDDPQVRPRAFRALRSLLTRISKRSLILWFIDDLQWGDADSAEALFEVLRPPGAPLVLFLGAFRSDEADTSPFLRTWEELQRRHAVDIERRDVSVGPLTVEECSQLVVNLLGENSDVIRRRAAEFAQASGGNPFLLIELVGCFDPGTDSFHILPIHEVIEKKLARLPEDAPNLLQVVAISGQPLSLGEASRAAGHASAAVATLTHMRNERLIRLVGPEENPLVDTYHDRIRETVLTRLDDAARKTLHWTLAGVIEQEVGSIPDELIAALERGEQQEEKVPPRVYDLAYHFDAAGEKRKGWVYALLGAEQARRQSALEVAVNNYAIAARNADANCLPLRYRISKGYGEALMLLGSYEDANKQLESVIDLVDDAEKKASIEVLQGELAFNQGLMDRSIGIFEGTLRRLGVSVPRSGVGLTYGLLREGFVQLLHTVFPFLLHRSAPQKKEELVCRICYRVCAAYCFQNTVKWIYYHLAGLNRTERHPPSLLLANDYAHHCCLMSMIGWNRRGIRYGDQSLALAGEFDDLWTKAHSCNHKGIGLLAAARFSEGIAIFDEAITGYEKSGDMWELHIAHFHKGCCHFGLGELADAIVEARWTFASSSRVGDSRTMCSSWLWARATRGNIPFEQLKGCIPCRPDDVMSTVHALLAEGYWHTFHGRTAEALQIYDRAAEMVRKSLCVNSHTILVMPMLAMGLRLHADAVQPTDPQQAEQLRKRAVYVATWATRLTWLFPAAYSLALRERALMLAALGKTEQALNFADRSCSVAEKQKAKYEHAQSFLVRGKLAATLKLPEAENQIRSAEAALDEIEKQVRGGSDALESRATGFTRLS